MSNLDPGGGAVAAFVVLLTVASQPGLAQPPPDIGDNWARSVPTDQGLDQGAVQDILDRVGSRPEFRTVRGIVIVRHGTLVAETYFGGFTNTTLKNVHSVSKSVTSLATGIALDRGLIPSVDARLADLVPHYAHRLSEAPKNRLTLRHALTMTAGLAWNDTDQAFWNNPDSVDYVLTRDVVAQPGAEFFYSSGLSHVIAEANSRASGQTHLAFIRRHLFRPLGIHSATWDQDLSGRHWGGTGLRIRPRDMAKIGQLALQEGLWEGRRLVSHEWIAESTRSQTGGIAGAPSYGYQWWIRPRGRYLAHGYNGQYIGVDPEADVVMTMITLSERSPRPQETFRSYFEELQNLARAAIRPERRGRLTAAAAASTEGSGPGAITIEVRREGGSDGAATLAYRARNGSARAGRDFRRSEGELRWEHGDASPRTVRVPLLPNVTSIEPRDLRFEFEAMSGGIDAPRRMRIWIDPGGEPTNPAGSIEFSAPAFVGQEGGLATVTVERRGGAEGDVAVDYRTAPRSAEETDYAAVSGRLTWRHGESGPRDVTVPLMVDGEVERSELFDFTLSDVGGGADLPEARAVGVIQDMTAAAGCAENDGALCLAGGRFRVEVEWESQHNGERGTGSLRRLSDESGIATFFSPDNVELVVKILDGRGVNEHRWVFYGALSDVEYWLTVTDTLQNRVVVYRNPPGEVCGRGDTMAFAEPAGATGAALADSAAHIPARSSDTRGDCAPGALCLLDGRFEITAVWTKADGETGAASPFPGTDATGYMSFFSPGNIELAVKVLDGREHNNAFWLFAAGLTDIDYRLTVADKVTGASRTYTNPSRAFCGLADTSAFPRSGTDRATGPQ
ncbi:MAG: serine hydrolase [Holophagales bacterium]|nr:serine hydrolase [Holophagales bacterium]MYH26648.1 serine hydrolase [Holophagales bacterium]